MSQSLITCSLRKLEVKGRATPGYEPVIVGGPNALISDDDDTSYVEIDAQPSAYVDGDDPPMVVGTFEGADIPDGHLITGMFLAMKMRSSGTSGGTDAFTGVWDAGIYPTYNDANDAGYLNGDYFAFPEDDINWAWSSPSFQDFPEYGFFVIFDANEWSGWQVEEGFGHSFALGNVRGGQVHCYMKAPSFWGGTPNQWMARISCVRLLVRHAPIPDPYPDVFSFDDVFTPWQPVPNLLDQIDPYGLSSKANVSENETRTGLGGSIPWDQGGIDAFYAEVMARAPDDGFASTSDTANGLYVSFVFEDLVATANPTRVNMQSRMSVWKHLPYPTTRYVNSSGFGGGPVWTHQRVTIGDDDPLWEFAGLVSTRDEVTEWQSYELTIVKFEVQIYDATSATGDGYAGTGEMVLEMYEYTDQMEAITPSQTNITSTDSWGSLDTRANGSIVRYEYFSWPTVGGLGLSGLDQLATRSIPVAQTEVNNSEYVDVTSHVVRDRANQQCVWIMFAQNDHHMDNPFDLAPGAFANSNGGLERSIHGSVQARYEIEFPNRRYPFDGLYPLFSGARYPLRQRQRVTNITKRQRGQAISLHNRQRHNWG